MSTKTHGYRYTRTYRSWSSMKSRCRNPETCHYQDYMARGITYDPRWEKFENFLVDMGERPEGMTLDRFPDPNGNYCKENCRWATPEQQARNRRGFTGKSPIPGVTWNGRYWMARTKLCHGS
jgi:hypothetical protein